MARTPFDPSRIPAPKSVASGLFPAKESAGAVGSSAARPVTVTEISGLIRDALMSKIPGKVRVVGEVSNFSERNHWFFVLKDATATIRCVCFASSARKVGFKMADGAQVICTGRVDYFDQAGQVQLYVDAIEPVGQGALEEQLKATMAELRGLGYFDSERKKPLPTFPQRIVVITSRIAAALEDVINTKNRRWPGCELLLLDTRVQGAAAAPEIARAIDAVSKYGRQLKIDAILLTRGGGSIEDLWAFNERAVADAIFRCPLPVVCAIGHETDTTIAELVADERCATPTQAAMRLVPDRAVLANQTQQLARRLVFVVGRAWQEADQTLKSFARYGAFRRPATVLDPARARLREARAGLTHALEPRLLKAQSRLAGYANHPALKSPDSVLAPLKARLSALGSRPVLRTPGVLIADHEKRLLQLKDRLARAAAARLAQAEQKLEAGRKQLRLVGPDEVLSRGFTYTTDSTGTLIRSASDAAAGMKIKTVFADGAIKSRVYATDHPDEFARLEDSTGNPDEPAGGKSGSPPGLKDRSERPNSDVKPTTRPGRPRRKRPNDADPGLFGAG